MANVLKIAATWVLNHKAEIGTFLFAGLTAVAPEQYRAVLAMIATSFGTTSVGKGVANNIVKKHLDERGL